MTADTSTPGVYSYEVTLPKRGGYFQIVRSKDWSQVFYPAYEDVTGQGEVPVNGPDDDADGKDWCLHGRMNDVFKIEFQRSVEDGVDMKKVSWRKLSGDD